MPNVYDYEDFRAFIQAWLSERPGRTQRKLAKQLSCSESTISCVLNANPKRRRPVADSLRDEMCVLFGLRDDESVFFKMLVQVGQTDGAELEKIDELRSELSALRRLHRSRTLRDEQYHFFALWQYAALLELSRCEGFRPDPRWIADILVPNVTQKQVQQVLSELIDLKLLSWTPEGRVVPGDELVHDDWNVDPEVRREALLKRNLWALRQSARALTEIPAEQRHFSTLTFSASQEQLEEIRHCLQRCMLRVVEISEATDAKPDQVFELDMQLFPLSWPTGSDSA